MLKYTYICVKSYQNYRLTLKQVRKIELVFTLCTSCVIDEFLKSLLK